jgi:four helix bundle protein
MEFRRLELGVTKATMNTDNIFNFEKLIVYQKSLDYIDFVYDLTSKFPKEEKYSLISQWRRAANSVALNMGEGEGGTVKEFSNFLRISKRSVKECVVCTTISLRRKYITASEENESRVKLVELAKMNSGLSKAVKKRLTVLTPSS